MSPLLLLPILYRDFPPTCTCFLPLSVVFTHRTFFRPTEMPRYSARSHRQRCGARSKVLPCTWEGTVFMHQFVIKIVSRRKTLQTYGQCRKCRTHKPCQRRHRCLSPSLPWTWRPFCTQIFRLCVPVSCLCWLSSRIARWFPVSQRHRRHLSMRDAPTQCSAHAQACEHESRHGRKAITRTVKG